MTGYLPYKEYKESGVEWLDKVPTHWDIDRAKWSVIGCQNGIWGSEPDGFDDLVCIRVADFDRNGLVVKLDNLTMRAITEKERTGRLLKNGDLLIEKSGGGDQQLVGAVVEYAFNIPAVTSNFVARMPIAEAMHGRYIAYVHAHLYSGRVNYRSIKQTTGIQNIDGQNYLDERIAYPPLVEQQTIACFLDHKTAQIDALITKKEALLEKLAEKRTALISYAVTKGINPQVKMKDSGIEWLGQVPTHWDVIGIKQLTSVKRGASPRPIDDPKYFDDEGEYAWVRIADVSASDRYLENSTQSLSELGKSLSVPLEPGDLFLSIAGTVGKPIITKIKCCIHDGFVYFPTYSGNKEFLYYIFACGQPYLGLGKMGTQLNLNTDTVGSIRIGFPALHEQEEIVAYIDAVTTKLDMQMNKARDAIVKLEEYRTALITQAVTGKIDVREVEIPKA